MLDESEKQLDQSDDRRSGLLLTKRLWLLLLAAAGLMAIILLVVGWPAPVTAVDQHQPYLNTALPPPNGTIEIYHTFAPFKDGLYEIELEIARYGAEPQITPLSFRLEDDRGWLVIEEKWTPSPQPNQVFTLQFQPQSDSAEHEYTLTISSEPEGTFAPWGYDLDVLEYSQVAVSGGETTAQVLHFTTRYRLSLWTALADLFELATTNAGLMILSLLFLLLPGVLILLLAWPRTSSWDPLAWIGTAIAIGTAAWPLLWLWTSTIGLRWASWSLWLLFIAGWLLVIPIWLWRAGWSIEQSRIRRANATAVFRPFRNKHLLLLAILLLGLAIRLLAIRDLAFPAWVDSSRHALITAVMVDSGRVITDYSPYLPVERFPYHYGFHTISASLTLMTELALQQLLLIFGQLLNALIPLSAYAGIYLLTKRFKAAITAAFLIALPFLFPGYYATWGRMTQLTAMIVLPAALAFTWNLIRGSPSWRKSWWLLALLASSLFLIHFRVFMLYLPFAAITWLLAKGRNSRYLLQAGIFSLVLAGPRILRAFDDRLATGIRTPIPGYNSFPTGYLDSGWEKYFLIAAGTITAVALIFALSKRRWTGLPIILALWSGAVLLLLSGWIPEILRLTLLNLNSAYISFFLPLVWILAVGAERFWTWLDSNAWPVRAGAWAGAGVLIAGVTFLGIYQQVDILNPQTILAGEADVDAIAWLGENLPAEAKVAVNSWQWLGSTWAGSDGGAWILPLTGIQSTTPPVDYIYDAALHHKVGDFNQTASQVEDWSDPAQADWLRQEGVTHIFLGARSGYFDASALSKNPELEQIYHQKGVFIFALQ